MAAWEGVAVEAAAVLALVDVDAEAEVAAVWVGEEATSAHQPSLRAGVPEALKAGGDYHHHCSASGQEFHFDLWFRPHSRCCSR